MCIAWTTRRGQCFENENRRPDPPARAAQQGTDNHLSRDQPTASTRQVAASPAASWWNLSLISKPNYEGTRCFLLARFRVSDGEGRDYQRTGEGPVDRNGNLGFLEEKEFGRGV